MTAGNDFVTRDEGAACWRNDEKRLCLPLNSLVKKLTLDEGRGYGILRIVFTIILPPLGVLLGKGFGWAFILNIILTLLGYIPGLIHAFWVQTRD